MLCIMTVCTLYHCTCALLLYVRSTTVRALYHTTSLTCEKIKRVGSGKRPPRVQDEGEDRRGHARNGTSRLSLSLSTLANLSISVYLSIYLSIYLSVYLSLILVSYDFLALPLSFIPSFLLSSFSLSCRSLLCHMYSYGIDRWSTRLITRPACLCR